MGLNKDVLGPESYSVALASDSVAISEPKTRTLGSDSQPIPLTDRELNTLLEDVQTSGKPSTKVCEGGILVHAQLNGIVSTVGNPPSFIDRVLELDALVTEFGVPITHTDRRGQTVEGVAFTLDSGVEASLASSSPLPLVER